MRNGRGDVVFAPDPFKSGNDPRPWLILSADSMPFPGEFLCAGLTHTEYVVNHKLEGQHWTEGGFPSDEDSYCSSWVLGTIDSGKIRFVQGTVTDEFTDKIARDAIRYLDEVSAE